ncbi:MAG TPA: hypothetical protein VE934_12020 [Polaromonas sp.]|uniref:head-tail joining protein n=1 Tax=Polaromonas sp. TaxID=1869339 RepID=UPI002D231796|nr:hypothetical protein [Polaromonas sp.]HYW57682.1 hypothetical protein [Polaromonas sp.]
MNFEALKLEAAGHAQAALGEDVRYHYAEGNTTTTRAIFVIADVEVANGGQTSVESRAPMCNIRRCDVQRKPRQGDMITRRNVTYEVKQANPRNDASWDVLLFVVANAHANSARDKT